MPSTSPRRGALITGAVVVATAALSLATPALAHPLAPHSSVTLARGVTFSHFAAEIGGRSQRLNEVHVDLATPGVRVDASSPNGRVGDDRRSVRALTNDRHAIAGVNADFFDMDDESAGPRGALVTSGRMLKSPTAPRNADLVIHRSAKGAFTASVGPLSYAGEVVRTRTGQHARGRSLTTTNSLVSARAGGLTLLTAAMAPSDLRRPCALATASLAKSVWTVRTVKTHAYATPSFGAASLGLLSCSGAGSSWIRSYLRAGDHLKVTSALRGGTPYAAVSGGSVLVRNGKAWHDPQGEQLPYNGPNAETYACVSKSGTQLTLGTVDGYTDASPGVTYRQLTAYMLQSHCWSGIVLDGGGSTTLVAKMPGAKTASVRNVPADDPPRHVADALVVLAG